MHLVAALAGLGLCSLHDACEGLPVPRGSPERPLFQYLEGHDERSGLEKRLSPSLCNAVTRCRRHRNLVIKGMGADDTAATHRDARARTRSRRQLCCLVAPA